MIKRFIPFFVFFILNFSSAQLFSGPFYFSVYKINDDIYISSKIPNDHYLYYDNFFITDSKNKKIELDKLPSSTVISDPNGDDVKVVQDNLEIYIKNELAIKEINIYFQGCNKSSCFLPGNTNINLSLLASNDINNDAYKLDSFESKNLFFVEKRISGYLTPQQFITFIKNKVEKESFVDNPIQFFTNSGIWISSFLIIFSGLALNLTPCILPMIPINIAIIGAGANAGSKKKGFFLGLLYGLGITIAYGILGILVVLTGSQFGSLNSNPWFNLILAIIFLFLSLSMFGLFNIDFSTIQQKFFRNNSNRLLIIFFMGAISALLAGACVAPVVIAVLILSSELYLSGSIIGLFFPFFLGLGMALPWPFAGAGLAFLPKPGKWMQMVKYTFAILILFLTFWYAINAVNGFSFSHKESTISSKKDLELALKKAIIEEKPVIIDFWAYWCKSCKKLDETFKDELVRKELKNYNFIKFDASDIDKTEDVLMEYDILGLPTILVLKPNKTN